MKIHRGRLLTSLVSILALSAPARAVTNGTLSEHRVVTLRGGGWQVVAAGTSGRDGVVDTTATLTIAPLPAGATIESAWLYWNNTTQGDCQVLVNGTPVTGTAIGNTTGCQSRPDVAYRADVRAIVTVGGTYVVTGFPSSGQAATSDTDGFTLVVIWGNPAVADETTFVLWDGAISGTGVRDVSMAGFTVPPNLATAEVFVVANAAPSFVRFNQGEQNGDDDPGGSSGGFRLRATRYPVSSALDAGETALTVTTESGSTCYVQIATLFAMTHAVCAESTPSAPGDSPPQPEAVDGLRGLFAETLRGGGVQSVGAGFAGRQGSGPDQPVSQRTLVIDAIPAGASVRRAWLLWDTYGIEDAFVSFDGTPIQGERTGTAGSTCWAGLETNYAYRADVTALVAGNDNYVVSGLHSAAGNGSTRLPDGQGASLVVVWADATSAVDTTIIVSEGAQLHTGSTLGQALQLSTVTGPVSNARLHLIVGDGQAALSDGTVRANGDTIPPPGGAHFPGRDGLYWDTLVLDVGASIAPDDRVFKWTRSGGADCLVFVGTVLTYQTPHESGAGPQCGGLATTTTITNTTTTATTTSTTLGNGTTSTTLPAGAEICDNCLDDDGDGKTDLADTDCCDAKSLGLKRAQLRPAKKVPGTTTTRFKLTLPDPVAALIDPARQHVVLQLHGASEALDWCGRIPVSAIVAKKGVRYTFRDRTAAVAGTGGLDRMVLRRKKGVLRASLGGKATRFTAPSPGGIAVTLGFVGDDGGRQCAGIAPAFRAQGKKGALRAP
jgi:Protein of unknown function (DUF3344)